MRILTGRVDVGISLENAYIVAFASALKRCDEACETSSYYENIDTCGLVGPKKFGLHSRVPRCEYVGHDGRISSLAQSCV